MSGWIIVGQSGQMDCHVFFKNKRDAELRISARHPDKHRRLVHVQDTEISRKLLERSIREIDRLYLGQPRSTFLSNPTVRAINRYLKITK
jgi:hypothetical protein